MTPSLEGLPTKAKEAPSPHEVRLAPLDTNPAFQCLGKEIQLEIDKCNKYYRHLDYIKQYFLLDTRNVKKSHQFIILHKNYQKSQNIHHIPLGTFNVKFTHHFITAKIDIHHIHLTFSRVILAGFSSMPLLPSYFGGRI